jgi:hypothetical protein
MDGSIVTRESGQIDTPSSERALQVLQAYKYESKCTSNIERLRRRLRDGPVDLPPLRFEVYAGAIPAASALK